MLPAVYLADEPRKLSGERRVPLECERGGDVKFSKEFFDLQIRFAGRVAELSGMPLAQALLDYTNFYVRFGLGRDFDAANRSGSTS